jgi:drug/metabolite transporter (DMT)-like permease
MVWGLNFVNEIDTVEESIPTRDRDVLLFLVVTLIWGFAWVVIKVGLAYLPPILFAALRMDVGAVVLLAYVVLRVDYWRPRTRNDVVGVLVGGLLLLFAGTALIYLGVQDTTSGVGAIMMSLSPVVTVALAAALLPDERLARVGLLGVVVAFVGVGFVVQPNPNDLLAGNIKGEELLFLGALAVGLGNVLLRRSNATMPPVALTAWALLVGAPAMHALSFGLGERFSMVDPTLIAIAAVLYLGVFEMAIAISIYFLLIGDIGATRTSFVQYTIPVVTLITGWLVLGEEITAEALVGFAVIFVGFLLLNYDDVMQLSRRAWSRGVPGG